MKLKDYFGITCNCYASSGSAIIRTRRYKIPFAALTDWSIYVEQIRIDITIQKTIPFLTTKRAINKCTHTHTRGDDRNRFVIIWQYHRKGSYFWVAADCRFNLKYVLFHEWLLRVERAKNMREPNICAFNIYSDGCERSQRSCIYIYSLASIIRWQSIHFILKDKHELGSRYRTVIRYWGTIRINRRLFTSGVVYYWAHEPSSKRVNNTKGKTKEHTGVC